MLKRMWQNSTGTEDFSASFSLNLSFKIERRLGTSSYLSSTFSPKGPYKQQLITLHILQITISPQKGKMPQKPFKDNKKKCAADSWTHPNLNLKCLPQP